MIETCFRRPHRFCLSAFACRTFRFAIAFAALACCPALISADEPDEQTRAGWRKLAAEGDGFVVWESSRSGRWRIWRRDLNGGNLKQLSPEEPGRDHLCPHLSPDGTRLVYLSFPAGKQIYQEGKPADDVALHLIRVDGSKDRVLAPSARSNSGGNRSAVWYDDQRLAFIDNQGITQELDLRSGKSQPLTAQGKKEHGLLINAAKTHATEYPTVFLPYEREKRTVVPRGTLPGCEPYFTHDGRWGFWMGGAGGPINRFELASEQSSPMLEKNDPRMPKGRGYLYFPMVSRDGRYLAFGASPNQHDHSKSDYDIFVARLDPAKLELVDQPVRYTFHPATDRYPDVYARPAAAGK